MYFRPDNPLYQLAAHNMQGIIAQVGVPALREKYRNQSRTRLVWDIFWASNTPIAPFYQAGGNDASIETMLRHICKHLHTT